MIAIVGGGLWMLAQPAPTPPPKSVPVVQQTQPVNAEPYREIALPESTRQQIYHDYRQAAGSTVEKQVPIPKDSAVRGALGRTLGQTLDREITLHASIHNISEDDVKEIIKEGNAKQWK